MSIDRDILRKIIELLRRKPAPAASAEPICKLCQQHADRCTCVLGPTLTPEEQSTRPTLRDSIHGKAKP